VGVAGSVTRGTPTPAPPHKGEGNRTDCFKLTGTQQSMISQADIVRAARGWIGTPYVHQASLKGVGTDCLGLVRGVWRDVLGGEPELPPPYAPGWAEEGASEALAEAARRHLVETPCTELQGGDVLLFRWRPHLAAKHAGIAVSATHMVHAQQQAVVTEIALSAWWLRHLAFVFRFPGVSS
jgi:NlpC/P60 family putative phage cell wall peptidase